MFCGYSKYGNKTTITQNIVSINFANADTSNVTNMSYMFYYTGYKATSFNLDLSNWNVSKVVNMSYMFGLAGYMANSCSIKGLSN